MAGVVRGVVKHAMLTPHNASISMGYSADRHRTRAPINIAAQKRSATRPRVGSAVRSGHIDSASNGG